MEFYKIYFESLVFESSEHLWRGITRTATGGLEQLLVSVQIGQSEVHYQDVVVFVQQAVLRFQVSVYN
jgi:hypothetical protein